MVRLRVRMAQLAVGGVTLGLVGGLGGINYANVLFELLATWINAILAALLGGDTSSLTSGSNFGV